MNRFVRVPLLSAAVVFTVAAAGAAAQPVTMKLTCQNIGPPAIEPFDTQPGHTLRESPYACSVGGGPLDGGSITARNWWEAKGQEWTLLSGGGVLRRPDGFVLYQQLEGKLQVQIKDGKMVGYAANGRGRYLAASGPAAQLAGKEYVWKVSPTGATSFQADVEVIDK